MFLVILLCEIHQQDFYTYLEMIKKNFQIILMFFKLDCRMSINSQKLEYLLDHFIKLIGFHDSDFHFLINAALFIWD